MPVWEAFGDLNRQRQVGFDRQAIEIQAITAWLDLHRVQDVEERAEFAELIMALDETWLRVVRRKDGNGNTPNGD